MHTIFPLIIHCSTDQVFCWYWENETIIEYIDLERTLPWVLFWLIEEYSPSSLVVINWPWWFTALRIGTLCVKISADHYSLPVYSWNKIDLYTHFITQWVLPSLWYIGIGQKKNVWCSDFIKHTNTITHIDGLSQPVWEYFIDMMKEHLVIDRLERKNVVSLFWKDVWLACSYGKKSWLLTREILENNDYKTNHIAAEYMIDPTLS